MNIVGYARVSTREQAVNGFTIDEQERRIREYVDLFYEQDAVLTMIREEGASARSVKRPKMTELLDRLSNKEFDVLIIHNLDRLTRNLYDFQNLLELFDFTNTTLISIKENIDTTTPQGKFFVSIIVLIAQWEEDMISDRTKRGMRESARQGNYAKPKIPFGYFRNPADTTKLMINPKQAEYVRYIFTEVAAGRENPYSIACRFRNDHIFDRAWTDDTVLHLIRNKAYYGTFSWHGEDMEDHVPPIVSKELWLSANRAVEKHNYATHNYIFRNKVTCRDCRHQAAQTCTTKPSGVTYLYYVCPSCRRSISEKKLIQALNDELNDLCTRSLFFNKLTNLDRRYKVLKTRHSSLVKDLADQKIDLKTFQTYSSLFIDGIRMTEEERQQTMFNAANTSFLTMDQDSRNEMIRKYIEKIEVCFETKAVTMRFTPEYGRIS